VPAIGPGRHDRAEDWSQASHGRSDRDCGRRGDEEADERNHCESITG